MIPYLVPDMPKLHDLTGYLERIDHNRWYSNFGPLETQLREQIAIRLFENLSIDNIATSSSGTSAIALALKALELDDGSQVLIPSYTFPGTVSAVIDAGYTPVYCDVDESTWQIDGKCIDQYLTQYDVKAIVPVATFGSSIDSVFWSEVSERYQLPVVVDAAAALGQQLLGNLTLCFSLHATKLIGAGEGGLIVSRDTALIKKCIQLSNFGYDHGEVILTGSNAKLSEYHAAVALAQLDRFPVLIARRFEIYQQYLERLRAFEKAGLIKLQTLGLGKTPSSFVIQIPSTYARSVSDFMTKKGIQTRQLYSPPLHQHKVLSEKGQWKPKQLVVSELLGETTLALPFHNFLTLSDVEYICDTLRKVINHKTLALKVS